MNDDLQDENNSSQDLQLQLEEAKKEAENNLNGWKRALADFKNFETQQEKKNTELVEFAREVAVAKLLPFLDSLEQALKHAPSFDLFPNLSATNEEAQKSEVLNPKSQTISNSQNLNADSSGQFIDQYKTWLVGVDGLVKQLDKALEELGVRKIEALGKKFDPNFHEAVREVESEEQEGAVIEEFVTGYSINGKVIRPSQVGISKGSKE